jgi:predicted enzyme related to lactoylglutathione lyase
MTDNEEYCMPEMTAHPPNVPFWVDLASPDLDASAAFFEGLFGWDTQRVAGPEMGNYTNFTLNGKNVAGLASVMAPGQPTAWSVYMSSDDIDSLAKRVTAAGGSTMMEPGDVPGAGRMGFFGDPTGAAFGVLQPAEHSGAQIVMEPNTFTWTELQSRDIAAAKPFYHEVFGWGSVDNPMGEAGWLYTEWKVGETSVGGGLPMQPSVPAEVPSHWLPYFLSSDLDASVTKLGELGGNVMVPPSPFPGGRFSVVTDNHGAAFGMIENGA